MPVAPAATPFLSPSSWTSARGASQKPQRASPRFRRAASLPPSPIIKPESLLGCLTSISKPGSLVKSLEIGGVLPPNQSRMSAPTLTSPFHTFRIFDLNTSIYIVHLSTYILSLCLFLPRSAFHSHHVLLPEPPPRSRQLVQGRLDSSISLGPSAVPCVIVTP